MHHFKVRNFEKFQHYKHRNPPWIKLYYDLLHDRRFFRLDDASKWLAIGVFLLASRNDNQIPMDEGWIERELGLTTKPNWQVLIDAEFIQPIDCDASTLLATCIQMLSQSRDRDRVETETEILSISKKTPKSRAQDSMAIFGHWNKQPALMRHRRINGHEKAIQTALKHYTEEEIKRAIERYGIVRTNEAGKYRDVYQWTLQEFLSRQNHYNLERFNAENWELPFLIQTQQRQLQVGEYERLFGSRPPADH